MAIGIDIGYETIKLIELKHQAKRWRLGGMNIVGAPIDSWAQNELKNSDEIARIIRTALETARPEPIKGKQVMIALPETVIFSSTFTVPQLSPKELRQALPFQIAEKLSINPDEYYYDYETITTKCRPVEPVNVKSGDAKPSNSKKKPKEGEQAMQAEPNLPAGPQLTVFAVAAKKTLIDSIVAMVKLAGLEIAGIDIKPGAIARSVVPFGDERIRLVVDLGVGTTGASIVEGNSLRLTSTVPWGIKGILGKPNTPASLETDLSPVFDELVHISKFFENRVCPNERIEAIIISGSGASLPNIQEVFKKETGLETSLAEPFDNVDTNHFPVPAELIHTFADAIGLAMREKK